MKQFVESLKARFAGPLQKITDNGSCLLKNTPDIAQLAHLHSLYAPLSKSELEEFAALVSYPLPEALKAFYMTVNGLALFGGAINLYGLRKDRARTVLATIQQPFDIGMPNNTGFVYHIKGVIYIGSYQCDGSLIGYNVTDGTFISNEYDRLATLIDEEGNDMEGATSTVPAQHLH